MRIENGGKIILRCRGHQAFPYTILFPKLFNSAHNFLFYLVYSGICCESRGWESTLTVSRFVCMHIVQDSSLHGYHDLWLFLAYFYIPMILIVIWKSVQKEYKNITPSFHGCASVRGHTLAHLYELWTPQCAIDFLGIASGIARATFPAFQTHIETHTYRH